MEGGRERDAMLELTTSVKATRSVEIGLHSCKSNQETNATESETSYNIVLPRHKGRSGDTLRACRGLRDFPYEVLQDCGREQ